MLAALVLPLLAVSTATASGVHPDATGGICETSYTSYCLNSPGAGNQFLAVNGSKTSFTNSAYPCSRMGVLGTTRTVCMQQDGIGPDCLNVNEHSEAVSSPCDVSNSSMYWWGTNGELANVWASNHFGVLEFLAAGAGVNDEPAAYTSGPCPNPAMHVQNECYWVGP